MRYFRSADARMRMQNALLLYVANNWYCKLFDCFLGFVESNIP